MKIILTCFLSLLLSFAYSQAPTAFSYQAVARDNNGQPLPSGSSVGLRISILAGSSSGNAVYEETHTATTNPYGLFTLAIGNGTATSGNFTTINWGANTYFLQVEMDVAGGSNYVLMGTTQLLSVPYALYAASGGTTYTAGDGLTLGGTMFSAQSSASLWNANQLQGNAVSNQTPQVGQALVWNGTTWVPTNSSQTTYNAGTGLNLTNNTFSAQNSTSIWNAAQLQGNNVATTSPAIGQVLKWNGSAWIPDTDNGQSYQAGVGVNLSGTTINAQNATALWNANQLQGFIISTQAPQAGQYLMWTGEVWIPATLPQTNGSNNQTLIYTIDGF